MKLQGQTIKDEDGPEIIVEWIKVESVEEAKAVRFLREALVKQVERLKNNQGIDGSIDAIVDVFDCEGSGVFAPYEDLLNPNLE